MIIYRYRDLSDRIIKYIGIIYSNQRTILQRVEEHNRERKFKGISWEISYIIYENLSRTDAEYLESHYISLFHTDEWLNSTKRGWGLGAFVPIIKEEDWIIFNDSSDIKSMLSNMEQYDVKEASQKIINVFLSADSDYRKIMCNKIKGKVHKKYSNYQYWIEVKKQMDKYINNILYPDSGLKFHITQNGCIQTNLPFLGNAYYDDLNQCFYIVSLDKHIPKHKIIQEIKELTQKLIISMEGK